jgi:4'-phosphopantetheinyl transferase
MLQHVQQDDFPCSQEHPTLAVAEIHVWRAALDVDAAALQRLRAFLAEDELARAARYRFALPRRRFVVARGILRLLLGRYLGISPEEVRFSYTPRGKPALSVPEHAWLHFNLAHSEDWALYAVARGRAVGVDIERVYPIKGRDRLVERFFSAGECAAFNALPDSQKQSAFFATWTRKEAYMKGQGAGFALPLKQFDVSVRPAGPARLLADRSRAGNPEPWSLHAVPGIPGYAATVAARGEISRIRCWSV